MPSAGRSSVWLEIVLQPPALGIVVILVKAAGGLLALALVRPWGARIRRGLLLVPSLAGSLVLVLYGGTEVLVGGLVLADVFTPSGPVDEHALRWHVFLWDPWFLVWGVALGIAAWRYHRMSWSRGDRQPRSSGMMTC